MATPEPITSKVCSRCLRELPLDQFQRDSRKPARRAHCKDCCNVARKAARENATPSEKERALQLARKWKRDNIDHYRVTKRAWEARHPEKARTIARRSRAKYVEVNQGLANLRSSKSRAKHEHVIPAWADRKAMQMIYDECFAKNKAEPNCWVVDHIVPLLSKYVCGLHVQDNLRVITRSENARKHNTYWPDMWPDPP